MKSSQINEIPYFIFKATSKVVFTCFERGPFEVSIFLSATPPFKLGKGEIIYFIENTIFRPLFRYQVSMWWMWLYCSQTFHLKKTQIISPQGTGFWIPSFATVKTLLWEAIRREKRRDVWICIIKDPLYIKKRGIFYDANPATYIEVTPLFSLPKLKWHFSKKKYDF